MWQQPDSKEIWSFPTKIPGLNVQSSDPFVKQLEIEQQANSEACQKNL